MQLYRGTSKEFIECTTQNKITDMMKTAFFNYFRYYPSDSEIRSWFNSLRAVSLLFNSANILDHGIILEYQLPMTSKRLDCMVFGENDTGQDNAVIIELKQWENCEPAEGENEVITWVGGAKREVLHPSVQVGQYYYYLADTYTSFGTGNESIGLSACTYLHNYKHNPDDYIFSNKFSEALTNFPLFTATDFNFLQDYLIKRLGKGNGVSVLEKFEKGSYNPSKKLLQYVGEMIKGKKEYVLLDEQLVVYDKVLARAKNSLNEDRPTTIIIKGGPGTGKSVIAINLMADLLLKGYNAHYATGSKSFTETLRKIIGSRGRDMFTYFNSYRRAPERAIDVLVADEAHRIRETSRDRYTPRPSGPEMPQVDELLDVARVTVFFIEIGQDVHVIGGDINEAINEGVRIGYGEGYLRKSMVASPLRRVNTGDNTPPVVHFKIVPGDKIRIVCAPKGAGSENMSAIRMLTPSDGINGIKKFVLECVEKAGPNPCPPIIVGVGIGGTFEKSAIMAKEALLRPIGQLSDDKDVASLERELLQEINSLGIGPSGFGGVTTALAVNIETYPCHIGSLPVAVNINCHAARHKEIVMSGE